MVLLAQGWVDYLIEFSITTRSCTCSILAEFINKLLACRSWPSTITWLNGWTDTKNHFLCFYWNLLACRVACCIILALKLFLHRTDNFFMTINIQWLTVISFPRWWQGKHGYLAACQLVHAKAETWCIGASSPGHSHADFILQPWRKIWRRLGNIARSWIGNDGLV